MRMVGSAAAGTTTGTAAAASRTSAAGARFENTSDCQYHQDQQYSDNDNCSRHLRSLLSMDSVN